MPVHASTVTPKSKPDARPMRMALGAGGLAAMSALAAGIVMPPSVATLAPVPATAPQAVDGTAAPAGTLQVKRPVKYIQLVAGQTPPPGAQVIAASAPQPITIVTTIAAPRQVQRAAVIIKTTQSGRVVK